MFGLFAHTFRRRAFWYLNEPQIYSTGGRRPSSTRLSSTFYPACPSLDSESRCGRVFTVLSIQFRVRRRPACVDDEGDPWAGGGDRPPWHRGAALRALAQRAPSCRRAPFGARRCSRRSQPQHARWHADCSSRRQQRRSWSLASELFGGTARAASDSTSSEHRKNLHSVQFSTHVRPAAHAAAIWHANTASSAPRALATRRGAPRGRPARVRLVRRSLVPDARCGWRTRRITFAPDRSGL